MDKDESIYDKAAHVASIELQELDKKSVRIVAEWWRKNYLASGHKRLGRVLIRELK